MAEDMNPRSGAAVPAAEWSVGGRWARLWQHLLVTDWQARRAFPPAALDRLQAAIAAGEDLHDAQVCFVVEADLDLAAVWRGVTPRERAIELFAQYRVWDTADNNGVLVYLQLADRAVEIVADRGCAARIAESEWSAVARGIRDACGHGRYVAGALAGLEVVCILLARHFPRRSAAARRNELPDRPVVL